MLAYKIVQKFEEFPAGIHTSGPIALKSGYLRIISENDTHIEVGSNPIISSSSVWIPKNYELILKETVISQKVVGITTGTSTTVILPEGTYSQFSVGDYVELTGISPAGINTNFAEISSIDSSGGITGGYSRKITLNWNTSSQGAVTDATGELRRVIKIGASSGKVHITEIQIAGG